jgi:drug/metabolite transporter (DMT)-like permease
VTILTTQHVSTVLVLHLFQSFGWISLAPFQFSIAKRTFPLAICYTLNVLVALLSLKTLEIPMYGILKRMATVFALVLEWLLLNKIPSKNLVSAIILMTCGAVLAGWGDLGFSLPGYLLAMISSVFQALYLVLVVKIGTLGSDTFEMLYYNSTLVVPLLFVIGLVTGEFAESLHFKYFWSASFQATFIGNLLTGAVLQYSMFLCTRGISFVVFSFIICLETIIRRTILNEPTKQH